MEKKNEVTIDGIVYVPKGTEKGSPAVSLKGMKYCVVRTYSAGVFAGYLKERKGKEATLINARKLWYWDGAATLNELAMEGVSKPENCKFPCEVDTTELTEVIEVIPCREKARLSITSVPVWSAK